MSEFYLIDFARKPQNQQEQQTQALLQKTMVSVSECRANLKNLKNLLLELYVNPWEYMDGLTLLDAVEYMDSDLIVDSSSIDHLFGNLVNFLHDVSEGFAFEPTTTNQT